MFTLLSHQSLLIFLIGFGTSFIATTTGGIGMAVVPVLILFGLTPQQAAATFRLAITLGDLTGLHQLHRAGKVIHTMILPVLLLGIAGGLIGSFVLLWTPGPLAEKLLSVFILGMVGISLLKPNLGIHPVHRQSWQRKTAGYASIFFLSILSTYFSAATGLLGRTAMMLCFGQTFLESSATRKVQSLGMGVTSTIIFIASGSMHWTTAAVLAPSVTLGSLLGAAYAIRKGEQWVRSIFFVIVAITALILLF
ncbi:MAG: sulfite exporter TauE/SafE family protein [Candidatus Peribacteraceae bacterium]|nr:sulfite exporter TauE/SafE family protein [Candidatus Peribacteraceae bacterium]MDD5742503.1 sulfite exporter TauE/SafE family protein [Candidatus Peribacteraceae bacterium]